MTLIPPDAALRLRLQTETNQLQPVQPVRPVPADLPELQAGQTFTARIVETLPDNVYRALVAGRALTLSLPEGARTGDTLELVVTDRTAHGIVAQRVPQAQLPAAEAYPWAKFSPSGQMIAALLPRKGERPPAAPLNRGQPLLPQPPASGAELAPALGRAVRQSGLFYESHQAQWIGGRLPVAQLLAEPQGALSNVAAVLQRAALAGQEAGANSPAPQASSGAVQAPMQPGSAAALPGGLATAPAAAPAGTAAVAVAGSPSAAADTPAPAGGGNPGAGGSTVTGTHTAATASAATAQTLLGTGATPTPAQPATAASAAPAAANNAGNPAGEARAVSETAATTAAPSGRIIADELRPLVQQQLDALGTQRLVWHGELWPRQSVELEMHREEVHERAADGSEGYGERWNTTLRLQLPRLGEVGAALSLTGRQLRLAMLTPYESSAADLRAAVPRLHEALAAAGIELVALQIRGQGGGAAKEGTGRG